jgi:exodeoxyribonuclease VII small subunit
MTEPKKNPEISAAEEKLSFEQALEKLETIVEEIEAGEVSLEESIEKYARGIELLKHCRGVLGRAERKIQLLTENAAGELGVEGELDEDEQADESE